QLITFAPITNKRIGDPDFTIIASSSADLPVSFTSSDVNVVTVENGVVHITGAGAATITASQPGNEIFNEANTVQTLTVLSFNLKVQSLDGDNGQTGNNSIKPWLKIVNEDSVPVAYRELTARYWLTAENFTGINTWIDFAQMGNSKIKMKYVALDVPRNGAFGYIDYSFEDAAGTLDAGNNSGFIQSRFANTDWSNFSETDDYSYKNHTSYTLNDHITLYRNGLLVWGAEPQAMSALVKIKVYSQTKNSGSNTISTWLTVNNEGNVPVAYEDVSVRYWFTREDNSALNYWIDYAKPGITPVAGRFEQVSPALPGADVYFELKVGAAGKLYPLSNTGNIQYRITKANWSSFNQANDHSYLLPAPFTANSNITIYYKGALVWGIEPSNAIVGARATGQQTNEEPGVNEEKTGDGVFLFPNPVVSELNIRLSRVDNNATISIYSTKGERLLLRKLASTSQTFSLKGLAAGTYHVQVNNGSHLTTRTIIKL
ncbi:MAG: cellulose binding domain-containing protein, partial [Chitinophagaceae bacterium]